MLEQAVNEAVPELYSKAVAEHDVVPLSQPDLEITKLDDGKELAFTAEVDVRPNFDLPDVDALSVTVDNADVDPDQVEEYLGSLRERFASLKDRRPARSRPATSSPSTWPRRSTAKPSRTRRPPASPTRSARSRCWTGSTRRSPA